MNNIKLKRFFEFLSAAPEVEPVVKPAPTKPAPTKPDIRPTKPTPFNPVVPGVKPLPKLQKATADDTIDKFLKEFSKEDKKKVIK